MGTASGSDVESPAILLQVDTRYYPTSLQTQPTVLSFSAAGQTMPFQVMGIFYNGSQLDMTHSVQMSYTSQNPAIATVDAQGIVTA